MTTKPNIGPITLLVLSGPVGGVDQPRPGTPKEYARPWPHIAYTVALYRDAPDGGARREIWRGDYRLGVGNVKPRPLGHFFTGRIPGDADRKERAAYLSEDWYRKPSAQFRDPELWADVAASLAHNQKVKPDVHDVLYSVLSDGAAFFDALSFEEWCSDLGYNPDSIADHKVFDACRETGRQLTAALGAAEIERLRVEFQDY